MLHDADGNGDPRFCLDDIALGATAMLANRVRQALPVMDPRSLAQAAVALLVLERLPLVTSDAEVSITVSLRNRAADETGGVTLTWVSCTISESVVVLEQGRHFHEPGIGGDSESSEDYSATWNDQEGDPLPWCDALSELGRGSEVSFDGWEPSDTLPWPTEA